MYVRCDKDRSGSVNGQHPILCAGRSSFQVDEREVEISSIAVLRVSHRAAIRPDVDVQRSQESFSESIEMLVRGLVYAAEWMRQRWRKHCHERCSVQERRLAKSDMYWNRA